MTMHFAMNNQSTPAVGCPIIKNNSNAHNVEQEAARTLNDMEESFIQDFIQSTDVEEQPFQILESNGEESDINTANAHMAALMMMLFLKKNVFLLLTS